MDEFLMLSGVVAWLYAVLSCVVVFLLCVKSRKARLTTDQVIRAHAKTITLDADWTKVRAWEREVYGCHYHRPDGTTNELGYEPVEEDKSKTIVDRVLEQQARYPAVRTPLSPYDHNADYIGF